MTADIEDVKSTTPFLKNSSDQTRLNLRNAFGSFLTGVTVITTLDKNGSPRGFTANSFTSVSLDPPMLLICLAKSANSFSAFKECDHFSVNVLGEGQREISGLFASKLKDKFKIAEWYSGFADIPLISGAIASFVCIRENLVEAGDHIVLIGQVKDYTSNSGAPLGYFKGNYFTAGLGQPLVSAAIARGRIKLGGIFSENSNILLCVDNKGNLSLPLAPEDAPNIGALSTKLKDLGLEVYLDFLYSVYNDSETDTTGIFYHGNVKGPSPAGYAYFSITDMPLDKVSDKSERSALGRYANEYRHGSFGIYHGSEVSGTVQKVSRTKPQ